MSTGVRNRISLIVGISTLYIATAILLGSLIGPAITFLVSIPVALAAWLFGLRIGLISWGLALAVNTAIFKLVFDETMPSLLPAERLMGEAILLFFALVLGYMHELGKKLNAELDRRRMVEAVERQRNAELEAVYTASLQLTSNLELKPVLEMILQQVSALMNPRRIYVFLYDGERLTLGTHFSGSETQTLDHSVRSNGLTYTVARSKKRIVVPDVEKDPLFAGMGWTGAIVGLPLMVGDRVYGVMNVSYDDPRNFAESELRILDLLATQAAIALRNASAYENTRSYAETLEGRVAERTAELQNSRARAEAILNNSYDAVMLLNAQGVIQQVNDAYRRMFDRAQESGRELATLFTGPQAIRDALRAVVSDRSSVELEAAVPREPNNLITDLTFVPIEDRVEGTMVICTIRDVTERRQAEIRQRELTQGLRKVLALTYELISTRDIDSMWKQAVESAREVLGLERCAVFVENEGYMRGTFGTDRDGNTVDEREQRWIKTGWWSDRQHMFTIDAPLWEVAIEDQREWRDGRAVKVDRGWIVITPIHSAYRFIGVLVNDAAITKSPLDEIKQEVVAVFCSFLGSLYEHKRVEEEMRRALEREKELNELKSRFTSMISHELRTPLASIQLSSDLLMRYRERQSDEVRAKHLAKIQEQVKHMTSMIEDVLTFSNAEQVGLQLNPKKLDLRDFCADLASEIRMTNVSHTVEFEAPKDGDWTAEFDPKLMRQALSNLLLNAVKYSEPGSVISFTLARDQDEAVIRVADQGIGIPESERTRIFDVFYRAKNSGTIPGTGLGLALVRQIVEGLKGVVLCESEEGIGTIFTLRIPCFVMNST